jgi:hypothetical protein
MTTITTRAGKGSPLTSTEVDSNFTNLNTDKQEVLSEGSFANGDKTKLDGIASSATANPNAIDNVVEDTTPQLGGNLDTNSKAILFGDGSTVGTNNHLLLGAGGDLDIYHFDTGSIAGSIIGNNTGSLSVSQAADDQDIDFYCDNGSGGVTNYLKADGSAGELILYHYGSQKLTTKSTGIQTTGTVNVNGAYTLPTSDGSANQVLQTDGNGALSFATVSGGGGGITTGKAIAMAIVFG